MGRVEHSSATRLFTTPKELREWAKALAALKPGDETIIERRWDGGGCFEICLDKDALSHEKGSSGKREGD